MQTVTLANGASMPSVGLGMWKIPSEAAADMIFLSTQRGYRHIDSACDYGNEQATGVGLNHVLQQKVCSRDELWVTSKLWNTFHAREHVRLGLEKSLADLQLDYLDLYLIHFPIAQRYVPIETRYPPGWLYDPTVEEPRMEFAPVPVAETWGAMEELVTAGLVRNIGVSNFGTSQLRDLLTYANIRPAVLQVEMHPFLTQDKLLRYCQQEAIAVTAFSPLGAQSYYTLGMADQEDSLLEHPMIKLTAMQHGKSPAQIALRWGLQRGTAVIPKTTQPQRLTENYDVFDFQLTDEEMRAITALNRNRRFNDPGVFGEKAFHTFCPIYE